MYNLSYIKYLNQCDDILVIKNGELIEQGSLNELLAKKGHLATLMRDHIEIIDQPEKNQEIEKLQIPATLPTKPGRRSFLDVSQNQRPSFSHDMLTREQLENRRRLSVASQQNMITNEESLMEHIEKNQLTIIGNEYPNSDPIKTLERNRVSFASADEEVPQPEDAAPMKLVLEDQSILYKEKPIVSYLKSGTGIIITLLIFALFFLVHLVRILSGNFIFEKLI